MKKNNLNLIIDIIALIGFVLLTTTGVLMRYTLPPGSGHFSTIWGLDRHEWGGVHFWISISFFLILTLHLLLHWRWILNVVTGRPHEGSGIRVVLGVIGLFTVIALALAPIFTQVEKTESRQDSSLLSSHSYGEVIINGSMTLADVEKNSGVPVHHIIEILKLPATVTPQHKLGQLKRNYGFQINEVREIIKNYKKIKTVSSP